MYTDTFYKISSIIQMVTAVFSKPKGNLKDKVKVRLEIAGGVKVQDT